MFSDFARLRHEMFHMMDEFDRAYFGRSGFESDLFGGRQGLLGSGMSEWDKPQTQGTQQQQVTAPQSDTAKDSSALTQQQDSKNQQLSRGGTRGDTRLGSLFTQGLQPVSCRMDVIEEKDQYKVVAEVPGIPKDNLKITLKNGVLTLSGERKEEVRDENADQKYLRVERSYGSVQRSIRLPQDIDPSNITAKQEHGVLNIHIPRIPLQQHQQQQQINIQ